GQSPHSADFNYSLLTEDLQEFIAEHKLQRPSIIGHSMGGKTAMNYAVRYGENLNKLIVVDIVPKQYPVHHDSILEGLMAVMEANLNSRNDADKVLAGFVPQPDVRQFLLKNLTRKSEGGFAWKINVAAINNNIEALGVGMVYPGTYNAPALFVKGAKSDYYEPGDEERIMKIFPLATFATLDTGHWVQAENPEAFGNLVMDYLC
ncbi:MAG TPA: alpha/beta fold hydrolase, partial [Cyclobacteriaceae bacterium]|nr:alpha/beta fold hydrolase [Cyclobacteriaceae bacterium]